MAKTFAHKVEETSAAAEDKPILMKGLAGAGALMRSFQALPEIAYPSIYGATAAEKAQIMESLDALPFHHVSGVRSIRMTDEIHSHRPGWTVRGRANDLDVSNRIRLSRSALKDPAQFERTLIHEIGHTVDYESQDLRLFNERSTSEPFGEGPYISDYAKTNHREDFAESFEEYFVDPEKLKEQAPEKHDVIHEMSQPNFLERLVDREEFKETGKFIGEQFGDSEIARHTAQGAVIATGLLQGIHGVAQWARSSKTGDSLGHASGVLNTISGLSFFAGLNPFVGMAFHGANQALQSAVKRQHLSPEEVESAVTLPVRPLEYIFGRETAKIEREHRPLKVAAVALGGAAGGAVGAFVGPYAGVMAGYHLAGPVGGAVGMVAGGMLGFFGGTEAGGRLAGALVGLRQEKPPSFLSED